METFTTFLFYGGTLAGLIQYFVDFKKLPIDSKEKISDTTDLSFIDQIINFFRNNWEFFAYIIIGISGAFLLPLIYELSGRNMPGLERIRQLLESSSKPLSPAPSGNVINITTWFKLVFLGYGIVFGYLSIQLIKKIGDILLGRMASAMQQQKQLLEQMNLTLTTLKMPILPVEQISVVKTANPNSSNYDDDAIALQEWFNLDFSRTCNENPGPLPWLHWRAAKSILKLLHQVDTLAPGRDRSSDGILGDPGHQKRTSDHNAWVWNISEKIGIVTAIDITHDPKNCDCSKIASGLEKSKDERIKYVIWNGRIMNSQPIGNAKSWTWRKYRGSNPHDHHIHISVICDPSAYDGLSDWKLE